MRAFVAALVFAAVLATPAHAFEVWLATENDFLGNNPTTDDLYTWSIAFEAEQGPYAISARENSFTDRAADARFDETYLTVGRALPGTGAWGVYLEGGLAHVGRGVFGQDFQNGFHRLIGDETLDLEYVGSGLHASLAAEVKRSFRLAPRWSVGPVFQLSAVPGFQRHAVLAASSRWAPLRNLAFHTTIGGRLSRTSLALLQPHLAEAAPVARLAVVVRDRVVVAWGYNEFGDRREHVSLGYWTGLGFPRR
ncbi:MAG TPA: hypothetical protein VJS92_09675 [Candidatus Polarisedimenticolaceae bacterium]|nr:hypothetical protein [Candidatus Polarisedimenticolaceae bacterium]